MVLFALTYLRKYVRFPVDPEYPHIKTDDLRLKPFTGYTPTIADHVSMFALPRELHQFRMCPR